MTSDNLEGDQRKIFPALPTKGNGMQPRHTSESDLVPDEIE